MITEEYRKLNEKMHDQNPQYGGYGQKWIPDVIKLAQGLGTEDILDYGCGKGTLSMQLPYMIQQYDPAIPRFAIEPRPADLVVCTDVLEHIEPEMLREVLEHLQKLTKKCLFTVIHTEKALKVLEDGRNAHLIIEPPKWWFSAVSDFFEVLRFELLDHGIKIVARPCG